MMGQQCPKRLWLHKNRPDLKPEISAGQEMIFARGTNVGKFARQLFPGGKDASPINSFHYRESVQQTFDWIEAAEPVFYEAAFQYGGVMAALDILVQKDGKWYAYEVKSSTEVKDQYIMDAALQYFVMTGAGLEIDDIYIVHINTTYARAGELDLNQLFSIVSVKEMVLKLQDIILSQNEEYKQVLELTEEPVKDIGPHCDEPYECEFKGHCWKHIPELSVFNLTRLWSTKKFDLYYKGIIEFRQLPGDFVLSNAQELQVRAQKDNYTHIDISQIKQWLQQLEYPIYFMDFETFMPAVPLYDNSHPYQQIPFQFSIHIKESPESELQHYFYLGEPEHDPRSEFIMQLIQIIGGKGTVLAYNKGFEASRLKELQTDFPEFAVKIDLILDRLVDLMEPFQNKWYYTPEMNGSYSIKYVLPALIPELSYKNMEIGNGGVAMAAFEGLINMPDTAAKIKIRNALLEYCKLDTLAMVRILGKLQKCI